MVQQPMDLKQPAAATPEAGAFDQFQSRSRPQLPYTITLQGQVSVIDLHVEAHDDIRLAVRELFAAQGVASHPYHDQFCLKGTLNGDAVLIELDLGDGRSARDQYLAFSRKIEEMPSLRGILRNSAGEVIGIAYEQRAVATLADAVRESRLTKTQLEDSIRGLLHRAAAAGLRCWNVGSSSFGLDSNSRVVAVAGDAFMPVEIAGAPTIERDLARVCETLLSRK